MNRFVIGKNWLSTIKDYNSLKLYITNNISVHSATYPLLIEIKTAINELLLSGQLQLTDENKYNLFCNYGIKLCDLQQNFNTTTKNILDCLSSSFFCKVCFSSTTNETYEEFEKLLSGVEIGENCLPMMIDRYLLKNSEFNRYETINSSDKFTCLNLFSKLYGNEILLDMMISHVFKESHRFVSGYCSYSLKKDNIFPPFLKERVSLEKFLELCRRDPKTCAKFYTHGAGGVRNCENYKVMMMCLLEHIEPGQNTFTNIKKLLNLILAPNNLVESITNMLAKFIKKSTSSNDGDATTARVKKIVVGYTDEKINIIKHSEQIYNYIFKQFNVDFSQEFIDYCFEQNNNILFSTVIKQNISPKIKFTQRHMSMSCNFMDENKIIYLLNQMVRPADDDINKLVIIHNSASMKILDIMIKYNVAIDPNFKTIIDSLNINKQNLGEFGDILNMTDVELSEHKKKFMTKSNYNKINKNTTNDTLKKLFAFDKLENIKTYIKTHNMHVGIDCCECAMVNSDHNVVLYVLNKYNYKPSINHIIRVGDWVQRVFMFNKYYPELELSNEYKNQFAHLVPNEQDDLEGDLEENQIEKISNVEVKTKKNTIKKTIVDKKPAIKKTINDKIFKTNIPIEYNDELIDFDLETVSDRSDVSDNYNCSDVSYNYNHSDVSDDDSDEHDQTIVEEKPKKSKKPSVIKSKKISVLKNKK